MSGTSNYKESEDQLRFVVKPETVPVLTETFTINFANLKDNAGVVEILWETTRVAFDVNVEFDARVSKQIDEVMAGPSSGAYYSAASYYFNNGKDLTKALEWVNKSLEKGDKYWILSLKAQIQAGLTNYKGAIETATKAMTLASAEEDDSYVKLNKERIAEWTPKIPVSGSDKVKKR